MKKILVCALAIAALASCQKNQVLETVVGPAIAFENAAVDNATRAAADPSITTENITEFSVWGFMDNPAGAVFTEETVSKSGSSWTYANTQYWLPNHDYYFAAISPVKNNAITVSTENASVDGLGTVTFDNATAKGGVDLIYAAATASTQNDADLSAMAKVGLTFNHLLSKVKFTFTNGFENSNSTLVITNLEMVAPAKASINLAQADWWSTNQWVLEEGSTTLSFGAINGGENLGAGAKADCADERLTIPAVETQEYKVSFDVVLYNGEVKAYEGSIETALTGAAFEIGKAYNILATIDANNIMGPDEGKLYPIEFEVVEVKDWVDGNATYAGYNVNTAEELAAALEAGDGDIYFTDNITANVTIAAKTKANIFLNGYTLTGYVKNSGILNIYNGTINFSAVEGGTNVAVTNEGELSLDGVSVESSGYCLHTFGSWEDGKTIAEQGDPTVTTTIVGGEYTSKGFNYAIYAVDNALVSIDGGAKVTGTGAVRLNCANLTVNDATLTATAGGWYSIYAEGAANISVSEEAELTSPVAFYGTSDDYGVISYNGKAYSSTMFTNGWFYLNK